MSYFFTTHFLLRNNKFFLAEQNSGQSSHVLYVLYNHPQFPLLVPSQKIYQFRYRHRAYCPSSLGTAIELTVRVVQVQPSILLVEQSRYSHRAYCPSSLGRATEFTVRVVQIQPPSLLSDRFRYSHRAYCRSSLGTATELTVGVVQVQPPPSLLQAQFRYSHQVDCASRLDYDCRSTYLYNPRHASSFSATPGHIFKLYMA